MAWKEKKYKNILHKHPYTSNLEDGWQMDSPTLEIDNITEILAKIMDHCIVHIDISPRVSLLIYCGQKNVFTKYIKYHNVCYLLKKFFEFIGTIRFLNIIIIFFFHLYF